MLVLTRKRSEVIQIGNDIRVKVIRTGRGSVKIGIEAPDHVRILRAELCKEEEAVAGEESPEISDLDESELAIACSDQYPHISRIA